MATDPSLRLLEAACCCSALQPSHAIVDARAMHPHGNCDWPDESSDKTQIKNCLRDSVPEPQCDAGPRDRVHLLFIFCRRF